MIKNLTFHGYTESITTYRLESQFFWNVSDQPASFRKKLHIDVPQRGAQGKIGNQQIASPRFLNGYVECASLEFVPIFGVNLQGDITHCVSLSPPFVENFEIGYRLPIDAFVGVYISRTIGKLDASADPVCPGATDIFKLDIGMQDVVQ